MHNVTIELMREGLAEGQVLSKQTPYIVLCDGERDADIHIDCDQPEFEKYKQMMRYSDPDPAVIRTGLVFLQGLITKLLNDITLLAVAGNRQADEWLHIRLITEEKELIQLPYELTLTPKGFPGSANPFLLNPQRLTTLTREVSKSRKSYEWPLTPRILFAWASPGRAVPSDDHWQMFLELAKQLVKPIEGNPEPVPDIGNFISVVQKASLVSINQKIKEGIKSGRPFTHVHILAHGSKQPNAGAPEEFKLVLHDDANNSNVRYATGEELALCILETDGETTQFPSIVTLMACDSANTENVFLPAGSVAHQLHAAGIPCVFASQFPLSVEGSVVLLKTLYSKLLLEGEDPRKALYYTRRTLFTTRKPINGKEIQDWASLVAHTRFPGDIDEQLKDYRLNVLLDSLKTGNAWAEHVLKYKEQLQPAVLENSLSDISLRLDNAITNLTELWKAANSDRQLHKERYAEHSGLLGSAYKRKAEHLFRLAGFKIQEEKALFAKSLDALTVARDWYKNGYLNFRQSHWTGMQYLSLAAVLSEGALQNTDEVKMWTKLNGIADDEDQTSPKKEDRIWAWGTLMELHLLKPLTVAPADFDKEAQAALPEAKKYADKMAKAHSTFIGDTDITPGAIQFAQQSTRMQVDRYINWWPLMNPRADLDKLKDLAVELRKSL